MNIFISLSVIFWSLFPSLISYTQATQPPQKIKLTNLVSNGDLLTAKSSPYENQPLGFNFPLTTNVILTSGIVTYTPTSQNGSMALANTSIFNVNDKYYRFARVKSTSSLFGYILPNNFYSIVGEWELISSITSGNVAVISRLYDNKTSGFTPIEVDYIGAINLTAIFGVGNEPNKEYMDNIINEIGYFDGDYYYSSSLTDNYKWFSTGFIDKTGERDFLDYLGFFVWLAVPPIFIYLLYKLMKGLIYE